MSNTQASVTTNKSIIGGWSGCYNLITGIPLEIKHELNQPIHFYTNAGADTYSYSLVINGKTIETKRMVKVK